MYQYPIPSPIGAYNSNIFLFAASSAGGGDIGSFLKQATAKVFVSVDYSGLTPAIVISSFHFSAQPGSSPSLIISGADINNTSNYLVFFVSGGVPGVTYDVSVTVLLSNGAVRTDTFHIAIPDDDCGCNVCVLPVPNSSNLLVQNQSFYVIDKIQFFIQTYQPNGANIGDQWYNPSTTILSEYVTNGTTEFWVPLNIESVLFAEQLAVTATNTLSNLTNPPNGNVELIQNKSRTFVNVNVGNLPGNPPPFTVGVGGVITWKSTAYSIAPTDEIIAIYTIDRTVNNIPTQLGSIPVSGNQITEQLAVLSLNTVSNLSFLPADPNSVELVVNGIVFLPVGNNPPFYVNGKIIVWNPSGTYSINIGDEVKAVYVV